MSLSGVAIVADPERARATQAGERLRLFISDVGFVPGRVVRQTGGCLAIEFELSESVERDLLIRKLFTSGLDTTSVSVSTWSATIAMLKSIWSTRAELPVQVSTLAPGTTAGPLQAAMSTEKLPAKSLVVPPRPSTEKLTDVVQRRRALAA